MPQMGDRTVDECIKVMAEMGNEVTQEVAAHDSATGSVGEVVSTRFPLSLEPISQQLMAVHTPCQGCVFACREGRTQTGCEHQRTEAYRERGMLIEAENELGEFFIVNGRRCNLKRTEDWRPELGPDERKEAAREEVRVRLAAIIVCQDGAVTADWHTALQVSVLGLLDRVGSLPAFDEVILVDNQADIPRQELRERFLSVVHEVRPGLNPSYVRVIARNPDGSPLSFSRALDEGVKAVKFSHFYTVLTPGAYMSSTMPLAIDLAINNGLEEFVVLTPAAGIDGTTIHVLTHRDAKVGGHTPVEYAHETADGQVESVVCTDVVDKIRWLDSRQVQPLEKYIGSVEGCGCLS